MQDMIDRLKAAAGPSRHLDSDLALLLEPDRFAMSDSPGNHQNGHLIQLEDGKQVRMTTAPHYTRSIEDAHALKLKALPGQACLMGDMAFKDTTHKPYACIWTETGAPEFRGEGENMALALCLATVRAVGAKTSTPN